MRGGVCVLNDQRDLCPRRHVHIGTDRTYFGDDFLYPRDFGGGFFRNVVRGVFRPFRPQEIVAFLGMAFPPAKGWAWVEFALGGLVHDSVEAGLVWNVVWLVVAVVVLFVLPRRLAQAMYDERGHGTE